MAKRFNLSSVPIQSHEPAAQPIQPSMFGRAVRPAMGEQTMAAAPPTARAPTARFWGGVTSSSATSRSSTEVSSSIESVKTSRNLNAMDLTSIGEKLAEELAKKTPGQAPKKLAESVVVAAPAFPSLGAASGGGAAAAAAARVVVSGEHVTTSSAQGAWTRASDKIQLEDKEAIRRAEEYLRTQARIKRETEELERARQHHKRECAREVEELYAQMHQEGFTNYEINQRCNDLRRDQIYQMLDDEIMGVEEAQAELERIGHMLDLETIPDTTLEALPEKRRDA